MYASYVSVNVVSISGNIVAMWTLVHRRLPTDVAQMFKHVGFIRVAMVTTWTRVVLGDLGVHLPGPKVT